jgi:hypothetical protein
MKRSITVPLPSMGGQRRGSDAGAVEGPLPSVQEERQNPSRSSGRGSPTHAGTGLAHVDQETSVPVRERKLFGDKNAWRAEGCSWSLPSKGGDDLSENLDGVEGLPCHFVGMKRG